MESARKFAVTEPVFSGQSVEITEDRKREGAESTSLNIDGVVVTKWKFPRWTEIGNGLLGSW